MTRRISRRLLLTEFGAAGLGVAILGACSSDDDSSDEDEDDVRRRVVTEAKFALRSQDLVPEGSKKGSKSKAKKWSKGKVPLLDIGSTLKLFPSKKLTLVCNFASLDIDYLSMISLFRSAYTPQYRIM